MVSQGEKIKHVNNCLKASRSWLVRISARDMLLGGILLALVLEMSGLLLSPLTASAGSASAATDLAAATSPFKGRPTRTPTPASTPTSQPTPTPTAAPNPTVLPTETTIATGTRGQGTKRGESSGAGKEKALAAAPSADSLLGWGLGALAGMGVVFGVFIVLFTRRTAHLGQQPPFTSSPSRSTWARLNQRYQLLPTQRASSAAARDKAEPVLEEDQDWQPLPPLQENLPPPPLKPPRWMIDAGLLPGDTGEQVVASQQELSGKGTTARDELNLERKALMEVEHEFSSGGSEARMAGWAVKGQWRPQRQG